MSPDGITAVLGKALPDFIRRRYIGKFAVGIAIIAIITAGAAFLLLGSVQADVTQEVKQELELAAQNDAENLATWLENYQQETRMLSSYAVMQSGDTDAVTSTMSDELERMPGETRSIHYFDYESDEVLASTDDSMVGQDMTELDMELHLLEDGEVVDERAYEELDRDEYESTYGVISYQGEDLIVFVSPVEGTDKGVMIFTSSSERAELFTEPIEQQNTQVVNLEDASIIADSNEKAIGTEYPGGVDAPVVQTVESNQASGTMESGDEIVGYAPVEGTDWAVVTHAPKENALAIVGTVRQDFLAIIGLSIFGFVLIGATIGRNTARTLDRLSEQAQALADGNIETEIETSERIDEIGRLERSFAEIQSYLSTVGAQAGAIADQDFDASELQEDIPGSLGETLEQMRRDLEGFIAEVEEARDEARQSQAQAEELAETLEQQAVEFGDVLERVAKGDLTKRLDTDIDNDAMREIAETVNEMIENTETTIAEIQQFAQEVAAASEEANAGAEEVKRASEEVSESIQKIATGTDEQREKIEEVSGEMSDLSATIEETTSTAQTVASTSQETADIAANGETTAQEAVEEMTTVRQQISSTVDNVETLDELVDEIDDIVEMIGDIAEQTNMLALNANIEAARAGDKGSEAGDGFEVVADEVKQLAAETRESAEDVAGLIEDVQEQTRATVGDIQTADERVERTTESVQEAVEAFVNVVENVETTNDGIQEISQAMENQATSSEEVVTMVDDVSRIGQSTAEEAETVSAAAEEQASSMTQVSSNVESLVDQAERLQVRLEGFDVDSARRSQSTPGGTRENVSADGGPSELNGRD